MWRCRLVVINQPVGAGSGGACDDGISWRLSAHADDVVEIQEMLPSSAPEMQQGAKARIISQQVGVKVGGTVGGALFGAAYPVAFPKTVGAWRRIRYIREVPWNKLNLSPAECCPTTAVPAKD